MSNILKKVCKPSHINQVFQLEEGWFFSTKEGINMGPYEVQITAEFERMKYLQYLLRKERNKTQS